MTEALFRNDAYLKTCEAKLTQLTDTGFVVDKTVFYPEGGGQPGDRGTARCADGTEIKILDTRKLDDEEILHIVGDVSLLPRPGTALDLAIDWPFRYRHMRTHTCLHLLCSLISYPVTGGSISQEKGRLDFDMSEGLDKPQLESELQALIDSDLPVAFRWISDAEMENSMELVRTMSVQPPMGQGRVRLVSVQDTDLQPCGGTHVSRTGEIGTVRIGKIEKKGKHNRRVNLHLD